jgi:hypothetical protein
LIRLSKSILIKDLRRLMHGTGGLERATLVFAMDQQFNPSDPNEGRLLWDFFGADLWSENRG